MKKHLLHTTSIIALLLLGANSNNLMALEARKPDRKKIEELLNKYFEQKDRKIFKMDEGPFKKMEEIQETLKKHFEDFEEQMKSFDGFDRFFNDWYGNKFGGKIGDVLESENDKYIIYKIKIKNLSKQKIDIVVEKDAVSISGTTVFKEEKQKSGMKSSSQSYSTFKRTFPAPPNVDYKNTIKQIKGDTIIIKFPKIK